jgi:hypothetical protein
MLTVFSIHMQGKNGDVTQLVLSTMLIFCHYSGFLGLAISKTIQKLGILLLDIFLYSSMLSIDQIPHSDSHRGLAAVDRLPQAYIREMREENRRTPVYSVAVSSGVFQGSK